MSSRNSSQLPGVDDSQVGISDLEGPQYPWSTHSHHVPREPDNTTTLASQSSLVHTSNISPSADYLTNDEASHADEPVPLSLNEQQNNLEPTTAQHTSAPPEFTPSCKFSGQCSLVPSPDGVKYYRKVVSHIFGRNKSSTQKIPDSVWIYYCRKHYQRSLYRADKWPFTQCELLLQTLARMESWGGVQSFELRLRAREVRRVDGETPTPAPIGSGRRHPRAAPAPVPGWLQQELGDHKSFDEIRRLVQRIHGYLRGVQQAEQVQRSSRNTASQTQRVNKESRVTAYRERFQSAVRFPDVELIPTFFVEESTESQATETRDVSEEAE
ncbi:hypothetical protein N7539_007890 [Penicillium diatomitis]|uniref:Uncharacterized protein n=1 Tax=Penicillium diatomitis TaxID=2819901 RepID=A0A9X0BNP8_9EURO|nr:uncharacterized protein N7539_007890 [Penicillium diatomitis]KAJ5475603.1 hypothetical protein N7539_007890 [Penicillium diatomitis]